MAQYIPLDAIWLGKLPENECQEPKKFDVKTKLEEVNVHHAREFFIYTFITTRDDSAKFQRGYYEMYTTQAEDGESPGELQFKQYMNVATGPAISTIDSANLWFPMGDDGMLKIKLFHASSKTKSIKNLLAGDQWSDVFIIGYRK